MIYIFLFLYCVFSYVYVARELKDLKSYAMSKIDTAPDGTSEMHVNLMCCVVFVFSPIAFVLMVAK